MNTFGNITTHDCINTLPPPDTRCQDAAFALANPDICPASPRLVIKPGLAITCALGSRQFSAALVTNGVETDVTANCIWGTSNDTIAVIGAISGNATGIAEGEATISATYQGYIATAELDVMACTEGTPGGTTCSDRHVAMMLLVDSSQSMSQQFGADYQSRLAFAKVAASRFAGEVNETKDTVGLISFNSSSAVTLDTLSADKSTVQDHIALIAQTQQKTAFYDALVAAIAELDASAADFRVIVLFSDGEDTSPGAVSGYVDANNPVALLSNFKEGGGIVMCLGCRSSGTGFGLLSLFATGGFFINGYPGTEEDAQDYLSGLKGYICAGNCTPTGDVMAAKGQLNYDSFTNWTVSGGNVDLIGEGLFDLIPTNGLYVDLAGTGSIATAHNGRMVSRTPFSLTAGKQYRVSVDLAGNQREADRVDSVILKVFYLTAGSEVAMLSHAISIDDYSQDFHNYAFTFTAPAAVDAYIAIELDGIPTSANANFGPLLGKVTLDNATDLISLLSDDFDDENMTYIEPACGQGSIFVSGGYAVGYNCYGVGCLDTPPPAQQPDPHPLPDIESGYTPAETISSTKTACASCATGFVNLPELQYTRIAQPCSGNCTVFELDDGAALVQAFSIDTKNWTSQVTMIGVVVSGSNDLSAWVELYSVGRIDIFPYGLVQYFVLSGNSTAYSYYKIEASGGYPPNMSFFNTGVRLHGVLAQVCESATATGASQTEADANAYAAALALAQGQLNCAQLFTATEQVTIKCPSGTCGPDVTKSATATSALSQADAVARALAAATALAQAEIDGDCAQNNNTLPIELPALAWNQAYYAQAIPFPSVQYVTDAGNVAKVTVTLKDIDYSPNGNSFQIFLKSPSGTCVLLWSDLGTSSLWPDAVTITIDDDGAAMPVAPALLADGGTYAPNTGGLPPALAMPATAPQDPGDYKFALSEFIGEPKAGAWSLWVCSRLTDAFHIAGGFEVTIT